MKKRTVGLLLFGIAGGLCGMESNNKVMSTYEIPSFSIEPASSKDFNAMFEKHIVPKDHGQIIAERITKAQNYIAYIKLVKSNFSDQMYPGIESQQILDLQNYQSKLIGYAEEIMAHDSENALRAQDPFIANLNERASALEAQVALKIVKISKERFFPVVQSERDTLNRLDFFAKANIFRGDQEVLRSEYMAAEIQRKQEVEKVLRWDREQREKGRKKRQGGKEAATARKPRKVSKKKK